MSIISPRLVARLLLALLSLSAGQAGLSSVAHAQDASAGSVHWAYSAYFGTGWYEIGDDRDVYTLRVMPRWTLREASLSEGGKRELGIEFRLAITAGVDSLTLEDIPGVIAPDNLAGLSATPGIDITVPITDRWTLRPYASIGWGKLLNNSESAWTYWAGIKSRYTFSRGKLDWALVNSFGYVGYTSNLGPSEEFWPLMAGLEFDLPFGDYRVDDEPLLISWHGLYTTFENDLNLDIIGSSRAAITDQWEFGLSLRKETSPIKITWFSFDRLGLAYRFSSAGELKGISLVFNSAFDR